jgi:hypothetical protein
LHWDIWQDHDLPTISTPTDSPQSLQVSTPPAVHPARHNKSRRLRSQITMKMYLSTKPPKTGKPTATPTATHQAEPTTSALLGHFIMLTKPRRTHLNTHSNKAPHRRHPMAPRSKARISLTPAIKIMHHILHRRTAALLKPISTSYPLNSPPHGPPPTPDIPTPLPHTCHPSTTTLSPKLNNTPHPTTDTHSFHPTATYLSPSLNNTSLITNATHTCHTTTTTLHPELNSPPFPINDIYSFHPTATNLSPPLNSTSLNTNETHTCHPTTTTLSPKLNSTPFTINHTYNSPPTAPSTIMTTPLPPLLPTISDSKIALGPRLSLAPHDYHYPTQASTPLWNLMVNNTTVAPKRINLAHRPRWYLQVNGRQ